MSMEFKDFLKAELEKPAGEWYTKDGNSERAVVCRGLLGEILWQYKAFPGRIKCEFDSFGGLETPLGWFIQLPIMIIFAPVLPIPAGFHWYKKSIGAYKVLYNASLNKD